MSLAQLLAGRMQGVQQSFIREILKVTNQPDIISFAGGLPNPNLFPVQAIAAATERVLAEDGRRALQYSPTEGYEPLRAFIAARYRQQYQLDVTAADILITTGSQQGLDLIGKLFLEPGDGVVLERPSYLGAIQALSLYQPRYYTASLLADGIAMDELAAVVKTQQPKLFYTVPTFQNPSGMSYSVARRREVAQLLRGQPMVLVEDDPYGEIRFTEEIRPPLKTFLPEQTILLGSFSKVISPALRLGWLCAPPSIMRQLVTVKQAADLQTSYLAQRIAAQYLQENDLEAHLQKIRGIYQQQRDLMLDLLAELFPPEVQYLPPQGGMFIWLSLPPGRSAMALFEQAIQQKVAFVPGTPFYVDGGGDAALRLNFSNASEQQITTGMQRLATALRQG